MVNGSRARYDDGSGTMRDYVDENIHGTAARQRLATFIDKNGDNVEYDRNNTFDNRSGSDAEDRAAFQERLRQSQLPGQAQASQAEIDARRRGNYVPEGDDRGVAQVLQSALRRRT
jgi:hypothetical protein